MNYKFLFLSILMVILVFPGISQEQDEGEIKKFIEFFTIHPNAKAVKKDSSLYPSKIILAPVINFSPETSLGLGVGAKFLFKMKGSGEETRTSNMPVSILYTLQNQVIVSSGFEIFSNQENWMLTGNLLYQQFPRLYYGIGRNTSEENEEEFEFSQVLIEPILLKRAFTKYLFLGGGIRYNNVYGVTAEEDGLLVRNDYTGALGATSVGAELAAVYDSRNNLLNTQNGWYIELTHGFYGKVLGGTHQFNLTRLDLRHFFKPFKNRDDVLAFQMKMHISHGETPLTELALFGSQEIMRGYYEGRFIGRHMLATQVEYRRNLIGRLGGVFFVGVGDVANKFNEFTYKNLRLSAGFGLRFLLEKKEKLNIRMDWGFGNNTNNYYLNIAEAF